VYDSHGSRVKILSFVFILEFSFSQIFLDVVQFEVIRPWSGWLDRRPINESFLKIFSMEKDKKGLSECCWLLLF